MYNYHICPKRDIFCVDQKSFFASVSCIMNGLEPQTTKLAVVADTKNPGAVVLAATPELKKLGIKTGSRLFEIPGRGDIYIINPSMKTYLDYSAKITEIALKYVAPEDFHQYSVDEFFMDVTESYYLFAENPKELAVRIQREIYEETAIECAVGIGDNILLSKLALDIEAKKTGDGIAEWRYHDVPEKLWPIKPLRDFWGISRRSEVKLNERGIFKIGDLAQYSPVHLKQDFGIIGVDWHLHANGIDFSEIREKHTVHAPSICKSQILMRDYRFREIYVVVLEHVDEVMHRLRLTGKLAKTVQIAVGTKDGRIYRKQFTVPEGTNNSNRVMEGIWNILKRIADPHALYRTISVTLTNFIPDSVTQVSLFDDINQLKRQEALMKTVDALKVRYGQLSVMRALSCTEASTLKLRDGLIAGHKR
ncbi:Y-family DNA polymerase [Salinicoccus halodurans]|uniref:DNA polymerase V n=1 Tax=Salinicoccus halodurans TaxID=407035 RepID=A0A0F7D4F7_9STAP|nr:Y-family DNA polymerase [Salinicoccus halodurans]AKG74155.1 DNA repair protein [Salinicoccus halodurans]SFK61229.1 DNA polymerase V [Salinicoccus halodurans]